MSGSAGYGTDAEAAGGFEQLARRAGERREQAAEPGEQRSLLAFTLEAAPYAIPIERVREIVRLRPIRPVPGAPDYVCGVIALRGEIVQVVDMRLRLGLPAGAPTKASRIVVVTAGEGQVAGMLVDAVNQVMRVDVGDFRPAGGRDAGNVDALCLRGEVFVSLMDLDRVMQIDADE